MLIAIGAACVSLLGQTEGGAVRGGQQVRTVSIPISIYTKQELRENRAEEFIQIDRLIVKEDRDEQTILSIRNVSDAPLSLAVLIQEDLASDFNLKLPDIAKFIRSLPRGSRIMVAYLRGGSIQVRQRFTEDLEAAARSLRIVTSSAAGAPRNPYDAVGDILNRFDGLPAGRRAILLFSDGVDASQARLTAPGESADLDRAVIKANRRSVAVYSFYSPATFTSGSSSTPALIGQGSLERLSQQTGGRLFAHGSIAPLTFDPFFVDLGILLKRQFLLTYLSTHMKRGYHRVEVMTTTPGIEIQYPKGYYYR